MGSLPHLVLGDCSADLRQTQKSATRIDSQLMYSLLCPSVSEEDSMWSLLNDVKPDISNTRRFSSILADYRRTSMGSAPCALILFMCCEASTFT